jgi:CSLREA domain-containing protein
MAAPGSGFGHFLAAAFRRRRRRHRAARVVRTLTLTVLLVLAALGDRATPVAHAAQITVTSTDPGTGSATGCTLRDAITAANTDTTTGGCTSGNGADTIVLQANQTYTLTQVDNVSGLVGVGLPVITSTVAIQGNGATIARAGGAPAFRLIEVDAPGALSLDGLTLSGGSADNIGGLFNNGGQLSLSGVTVANNTTTGNTGGYGAGLANFGTATIAGSTFSGNVNAPTGGPTYGGGIYNNIGSQLTVRDSVFVSNVATLGGGGGGGIRNDGVLTATGSTFSGNSAAIGGGLYLAGPSVLANSTVYSNTATGATGGGGAYVATGAATVTNATIAGNAATLAGAFGGGVRVTGALTLRNTIVAGNTAASGANCGGAPADGGGNLDSGTTCAFATSSLTNTDPLLGPLADNGGPTKTMAPAANSPAINAGVNANCTAAPVNGVDQRGASRLSSAPCDIGAYEYGAAPGLTSMYPTSAFAGSPAITLTLTGTNFIAGSTVYWNASPRASSFVSATRTTAVISATDLMAAGSFTVTVGYPGPGDGKAPPLTFTVNSATAPSVTSNPSSQTVCSGAGASFTAAASGNPAPSVQWQVSTNGGGTFNDMPGANSTTLSFAASAADNGHQFRAVFTNLGGSATSQAATLTVNTAPLVTAGPIAQTVTAGQPVIFTVAASGSPAPSVQWQVSTNNGGTFNDIPGANSTTLTFTASAADDGKQYRAVFSNTCSSATSAAATLTVNTPPSGTPTPVAGGTGIYLPFIRR